MKSALLCLGLSCWILGAGIFSPAQVLAQSASKPKVAPTAATSANQHAPANERSRSYFTWFIRSSGVIGLFILCLMIYFLTTVGRLSLELRPEVAAPPVQLERCRELIQQRDLKSTFSYVRSNDSHLCRILTVGLTELPNGLAEARDTMERHGEAETVDLEKRISMLAVLGTLGPMIGLIGTLKGMIASFSVIAVADVQLRASEVAGGISEALLLTFEGVALSVPAIYFFAVFRNRVASISVSTMLAADTLLRQFAHAARHRTSPTASTDEKLAA